MTMAKGDQEDVVEEAVDAKRRRVLLVPAAIGVGQLGVGLITMAVGGLYDYFGRAPGWIVVAGLVLMGGPGIVWALIQAKSVLAGGGLVGIDAPGRRAGKERDR